MTIPDDHSISPRFRRWVHLSILLATALFLAGCAGNGSVRPEDDSERARSAEVDAKNCAKVFCGTVTSVERVDPFADDPFDEPPPEASRAPDPFETINRGVFWFNDKVYFYAIKPTVRAYRAIFPATIRRITGNIFSNLSTPIYFANDVLQLDGDGAVRDFARFTINTTLGVFGAFDVARNPGGIPGKAEDMGQTLGHYGLGHGFYLVVPLWGPSSLRDGAGTLADFAFYPLTWMDYSLNDRLALKTIEEINDYSMDKDLYEAMVRQSLDPYLTIRNGYLQLRAGQIDK